MATVSDPTKPQVTAEEPDANEQTANTAEKKTELPSFMKSVFSGYLPENIVFPFPQPSKEEREEIDSFLKALEKFLVEKTDPPRYDREEKLPPEIIKGLQELGVFALTAPEEYGGLGVSNAFFCQVMGKLSQYCGGIAATIGAHLSIGTKGLFIFGSEEQKKFYGPKIAEEWVAAFSLTESQAGSDAGSIRATARLAEDGEHYLLNGEKIFVTNGGIANFFTLFAKVVADGEEGEKMTAFLVTRDMEGFSSGKEEKKLGLKASSTTPLILNDVKVPRKNILGEEGKGFKIAMEILNRGRLGLGACCAGGAHMLIHEATKYANQRKQFGMSLSQFGLIQKKIARMTVLTFAVESSVYLTAGLADRKDVDYSIEAAICKVFATESVWEMVNETVQIFGGNGFIAEFPAERALRDSRVNMIFEGTNEILRLFIALSGLRNVGKYLKEIGRALDRPLQSLGIISGYFSGQVVRIFFKEKLDDLSPLLEKEARIVDKYTSLLNKATEKELRRHKKDIIHQQLILERMANMAIYIYTLVACISRVDSKLKAGKKPEEIDNEIKCLKAYARIARKALSDTYRSFNDNHDRLIKKISAFSCEEERYSLKLWE